MTTIQRFTPDYKMHAVRFEAFSREAEHGELVRFDAHQQVVSTLEAERDAQQKRADALAVENAGFKHALSVILEHVDVTDKGQAGVVAMIANDELFNSDTRPPPQHLQLSRRREWRSTHQTLTKSPQNQIQQNQSILSLPAMRMTLAHSPRSCGRPNERAPSDFQRRDG